LRKAGWHTIAQDEATSVIWGMPRAAAEIGAAVKVLPVSEIGAAVVEEVSRRLNNQGVAS
jgi:two-component system response regulator WspF